MVEVMVSCGVEDHHPTADNPHTFVKFFGRISFLFGFWALFVFFKVWIEFDIFLLTKIYILRSSTHTNCWMGPSTLLNSAS